ncbi:MAG: PD-(D/E)XK nuclease family protein [bacterium]|nr:PD-(D/E)XK nuclease family protein [bacterium]
MPMDKYSAVWVSHSSMGDFLKCPRCYYLHNVYKSPKTGRKISIVSPALSLGSAVHEVLEALALIQAEKRFEKPLLEKFEKAWVRVSGKRGGFTSEKEEIEAKERAKEMILRVERNREPLAEKTIRIKEGHNGMPPNFFLSEEENIILCGKIDWLIHKPEDDSVHILDFKTGRNEENGESLQLPIYQLLLKKLQKRKVSGASYWYIERDDKPVDVSLPGDEESFERVMSVAIQVKKAREGRNFQCPRGSEGCFDCSPYESIIKGEAEFVGVGEMRQDLYLEMSR